MYAINTILGDFHTRVSQVHLSQGEPQKIIGRDPTRVYLAIQNTTGTTLSVFLMTDVGNLIPSWMIIEQERLELYWQYHGALVTFELWGGSLSKAVSTDVCVTELLWVP